jgi:hypothetical protein
MPVLENTRWEDYARALARGAVQEDAYEAAGFNKHRGAASRLANNPVIVERVREIKAERAALLSGPTVHDEDQQNEHGEHTIPINNDFVLQQLAKVSLSAQQVGNHKDAIKALEMLGQYLGLSFADKTKTAQEGNSNPAGGGNTFNILALTDALAKHTNQIEMKNITPPAPPGDADDA